MKSNAIKISLIVGICNTILILGVVAYVICSSVFSVKSGNGIAVESKKYTQAEADKAMEEAEYNMSSVYTMLLGGSYGEIGDYYMSFGTDGSYSGFYDNSNYDVSDCTYKVVNAYDSDDNDVVANVNIYNNDSSGFVQYKLKFDSGANLLLYYPDSDTTVQLR